MKQTVVVSRSVTNGRKNARVRSQHGKFKAYKQMWKSCIYHMTLTFAHHRYIYIVPRKPFHSNKQTRKKIGKLNQIHGEFFLIPIAFTISIYGQSLTHILVSIQCGNKLGTELEFNCNLSSFIQFKFFKHFL